MSLSTLGTEVETMFRQHCVSIVATSLSTLGTEVETMFRQCCVKVVWTLVPIVADQHCDNIHTTLPECYLIIGQCKPMMWQSCGNVGILVEIQHWYNDHTTLSGRPHNIAGTFKSIYKWMSPQHWVRHWDNVGTNVVTTLPQHWIVSWDESKFLSMASLLVLQNSGRKHTIAM